MWIERLERLETLMNGSNTNEKIYSSRILPTIIRTLKQPELHENEISIIAKIISNGFYEKDLIDEEESNIHHSSTKTNSSTHSSTSSSTHSYGYRIIDEIFSSTQITDQKLSHLIKILSQDSKIYLTLDEIKKVETNIKSGNKHFRTELLKNLQKKSQQIIEWMNMDIENLEKEYKFYETEDNNDKIKIIDKIKLYEILLKKLSEDKNITSGVKMLELIQKINNFHEINHHINHKYISIALKRSLQSRELNAVEKLWELKKDHSIELHLLYSLLLLDNGKLQKTTKILSEIKKLPNDEILIKIMETCNINKLETLEIFINLLSKQFSLNNITNKKLLIVVKKIEMKNYIKLNNLTEAFSIFHEMTNMLNSAFEQYDLMVACVNNDQPDLLKKIFNLIIHKHDKITAIIDMIITFLECNKLSKAEQLYRRSKHSNFYINSSKLHQITMRECEINRPDVLHHLFLLVNNPDQINIIDLYIMIEKIINMYLKNSNLNDLKNLQNDTIKLRFNLDRKLKAHLDGSINKLSKNNDFKKRLSRLSSIDNTSLSELPTSTTTNLSQSITQISLNSNNSDDNNKNNL